MFLSIFLFLTTSIPSAYNNQTHTEFSGTGIIKQDLLPKDLKSILVFTGRVTGLEAGLFKNANDLKSVYLLSIISLPNPVFINCKKLENVTLGDKLKYIGNFIENCPNVKTITIPASVKRIVRPLFMKELDQGIFVNESNPYFASDNVTLFDKNFTKIIIAINNGSAIYKIPDTIINISSELYNFSKIICGQNTKIIKKGAFENSSLESIDLVNVEIIESRSFWNCTKLENLTLPASLKEIHHQAIQIEYIKNLEFESDNYQIKNNFLYQKSNNTAIIFMGGKEVNIPNVSMVAGILSYSQFDNVTLSENSEIPESCFEGSTIATLTFGDGLVYIKSRAFLNSRIPKDLDFPSSLREIHDKAFANITGLNPRFSHGLTSIGSSAFENTPLGEIELPPSVVHIGSRAFAITNCIIEIKGSPETISSFAFVGSNVTNLSLPQSVIQIDDGAFGNCTNLKTLRLKNGMTRIGVAAFEGCIKLNSITFPNNLSYIDDYAFNGCSGLTEVNLKDGLKFIGHKAFFGTQITRVELPSTLTNMSGTSFPIGMESFGPNFKFNDGLLVSVDDKSILYYTNVSVSLSIPKTLESISNFVFNELNAEKEVLAFPNIKRVGTYTFSNCKLNTLLLGSNLTEIPYGCFQKFEACKLVIDSNLDFIDGKAFAEAKIEQLVLRNVNVMSVAFENCLISTELMIGDIAFAVEYAMAKLSAKFANVIINCPVINASMFAESSFLALELGLKTHTIMSKAFESSSIAFLILGSGVRNVYPNAILNASIISLTLPTNATNLTGRSFFVSNKKYVSFRAPTNSNSMYTVKDNCVLTADEQELVAFNSDSFRIPYVKRIRSYAYFQVYKIYENALTIPDSVEVIDKFAFGDNIINSVKWGSNISVVDILSTQMNLESFYIPDTIIDIGDIHLGLINNVTINSTNEGIVWWNGVVYNANRSILYWCNSTVDQPTVVLDGRVRTIKAYAFYGNRNVQSVKIGKYTLEIQDYAFMDCDSLFNITIPSSIVYIGNESFSGTSLDQPFEIPSEIERIGDKFSPMTIDSIEYRGTKELNNSIAFEPLVYVCSDYPYDSLLNLPVIKTLSRPKVEVPLPEEALIAIISGSVCFAVIVVFIITILICCCCQRKLLTKKKEPSDTAA